MSNNRNKRKINSKQANQISLIISAIYFICFFINGLVSKPVVGDFAVCYLAIGCVVGTLLIYFIFYGIIFKGEDIARSERERQIEVATRQCLSKTDYKQVYFLYEGCDKMDMIMQILQKEVCKFYAQIMSDGTVMISIKFNNESDRIYYGGLYVGDFTTYFKVINS